MTNPQMWNERFSELSYAYGEKANEFLQDHVMALNGPKIVCFAEGEGRNAVFLASRGYDVTAWDYAQAGLDKTIALAAKTQVRLWTKLVDVIKDELPEAQFDSAVMIYGHFHKTQQKNVFERLMRVVKPGGTILFEVYSEQQLEYQQQGLGKGGPRTVDELYAPEDVLRWIKPYEVRRFFYGEQVRNEGKYHAGRSHVIQVIVRKP